MPASLMAFGQGPSSKQKGDNMKGGSHEQEHTGTQT